MLLLPHLLFAEIIFKGKVTDQDGLPIPFVNIGFVGTSIGTVSSPDGGFALHLVEIPSNNSPLRFSCIGYEAVEVKLNEGLAKTLLEVELKEATIALREVVVRPGGLKTKEFGNTNENTAMKTNLAISTKPNMNLGAEVGRKFRLGDREHYINTLKFYVSFNNFDTLTLRINFYEVASGKPDKLLNQQPIVRQLIAHQKGWANFDLMKEDIVLTGTVVATVEWVGASKKGNAFGLNITMPAAFQTHYYKYGAQNDWKVFRNMSTSMVLIADVID